MHAAAVGSLIILSTFNPAISPAWWQFFQHHQSTQEL
jgi:hypothetical protein